MISNKEKYKVNIVWAVCIFLLWQLSSYYLHNIAHDKMADTKLPYPYTILTSIANNFTELMSAAGVTFSRAIFGLIIGALIGFILAILMSLSKVVEKIALPYLIISQMIPVLGLAPIIFTLVRDMNTSRIVIAAYITFFPVSINMLSGLNSVDPDKKELLYSYAAKKTSVYNKLMIPYSLPYLFAGLKIAAPMSITASILVDMLGSSGGIGVKLLYSLYSGTKDVFWGSVITSSFMGILSYILVVVLEKIFIPWKKQAV